MSQIYVEFDRLPGASNAMEKHANNLLGILQSLESGLAPLQASWSGEAQVAYTARKAAWDKAAQDLITVLKNNAKLTQHAHDGYVAAVQANVVDWTD